MMSAICYMETIRERYTRLGYPAYRWYHAETKPPWKSLDKQLSESRIGVLSTAGTYVRGQVAYFYKDDTSIRSIPKTTDVSEIRFSHLTEQYLPSARRDPNCVFPIEHLVRLEAEGVIGELANDLLSCMGAIYSQRRTCEELTPKIVEMFKSQKVDIAFLVPL